MSVMGVIMSEHKLDVEKLVQQIPSSKPDTTGKNENDRSTETPKKVGFFKQLTKFFNYQG